MELSVLSSQADELLVQKQTINQTLFKLINMRALLAAYAIRDYTGKKPFFTDFWSSNFAYRGLSTWAREAAKEVIAADLARGINSVSPAVLQIYQDYRTSARDEKADPDDDFSAEAGSLLEK